MVLGISLPSCEKSASAEDYPIMESFYKESVTLPLVTLDSVKTFSGKVDGYVATYPLAKEHKRYSQIQDNIKAASLRLSISIDKTWAGDTVIHF